MGLYRSPAVGIIVLDNSFRRGGILSLWEQMTPGSGQFGLLEHSWQDLRRHYRFNIKPVNLMVSEKFLKKFSNDKSMGARPPWLKANETWPI